MEAPPSGEMPDVAGSQFANGDALSQASRPFIEWFVSAVLCCAIWFVYQRLCTADFQYFAIDDDIYVTRNVHVNTGLSKQNVEWAFHSFEAYNWHPLTWISLQTDASLFGVEAWVFRRTNILIHAVNSVLLLWLWRRMTKCRWCAIVIAMLFALHPLHVESVAWIAERKDVLSGFFWLLTIWAYTSYAAKPGILRYALVVASFTMGLMSKPMLVTLPFALLLLDYWPLRRIGSGTKTADPRTNGVTLARLLAEKMPLVTLSFFASTLTLRAQTQLVQPWDRFPFSSRIANACTAYFEYLWQTYCPIRLAFLYPHAGSDWSVRSVMVAAAVLFTVSLFAMFWIRKCRFLFVGWFWFLGTLVPVIGLVQVGTQAKADRYMYVPILGLLIIVVHGVAALWLQRRWPRVGVVWISFLAMLLCSIASKRQVEHWQTSEQVFRHAIAVTPPNKVAHAALAQVYLDRKNFSAAISEFQNAVELDPDYVAAVIGLADVLQMQGRARESFALVEKTLQRNPENDALLIRYGQALIQTRGREQEAVETFLRALEKVPNRADALTPLGIALLQLGKVEEATERLAHSLQLEPNQVDGWIAFGKAQLVRGNQKLAMDAFEAAVTREQDNPESTYYLAYASCLLDDRSKQAAYFTSALNRFPNWPAEHAQLCWQLATDPDAKKRCGMLALLGAKVVSSAVGDNPYYLDVLAASLAEMGHFEDATKSAKTAADRAKERNLVKLEAEFRQRETLYRSGRPYRADSFAR